MTYAEGKPVLLRNARLVLPNQVIESSSLLIKDGCIDRIIESESEPFMDVESRFDLDGLTVFPGFIDVHIHGASGVDTMTATADDLANVSEFLGRNGVTAWMPTLVPASREEYQQAIEAITGLMERQSAPPRADEMSPLQARAIGVHYEGPFVNSAQCGALHREHFRTFESAGDLDSLPRIENDQAVHLITVAPEIEGGINLIKELRRRGWIVSIGHTRATVDVLDEALAAGARHMTHFMNAMTPLHHRAPGPVGWGLIHDDVTCDLIADGVHLDPAILKLILRSKTADRISLISDAVAPAGLGDGNYQIWGETIQVINGRTQNSRGNIAGSVITMLDAMRMMLSLGVSESEAARMAATNPARLLGIAHECGSIEEGKRADLVALNPDGEVQMVLTGGVVSFPPE
ncbi:MAG: N-acetylglucosamine-6-phosphate deacetylase [Blastocatellia bacterium]|nr:N-acetylglucosamine-6-phosphate deacetylase [Blastocatellia bacterium]